MNIYIYYEVSIMTNGNQHHFNLYQTRHRHTDQFTSLIPSTTLKFLKGTNEIFFDNI